LSIIASYTTDLRLVATLLLLVSFFFLFNATATPEIYTLSLHDALPILGDKREARRIAESAGVPIVPGAEGADGRALVRAANAMGDRKSTRLNSSHGSISYAVFCLKKKKKYKNNKKTQAQAEQQTRHEA